MATLVEKGNSMPLGPGGAGNSSSSREDMIINKTKEMAFPTDAVISLENFEHFGDRPAGTQQSLADMNDLTGKALQESYRAGHPKSAAMTDKVSDR
jgi:hypothetical protein